MAGFVVAGAAGAAEVDFRKEVLPLLAENCFSCHGPDEAARKGGLRLDRREDAVRPGESGKAAIVAGQPEASGLLTRIASKDPEMAMPPAEAKKVLPPGALATLRKWIEQGAKYQNHWAFDPLVRPEVPQVAATAWPVNPIDRFILARLEREKLQPSAQAAKTALLRRVTLDLTGLPPKPEEISEFLADEGADGYTRAVDRLLASPRYGEHMAMPWLDAARYADSNGFQQDGDTYQYVWRDWVVRALNGNMPFDQFAIEQLAGDLLPQPTTDQLVATAFNRNHMLNGEGGAIAEEQRNVILSDRVDVTATAFLGLTVACAQCHDHKYDPVPQRDYYRLMAFFNQVPESGVPAGGGQYRIADPWIYAAAPGERDQLAKLEEALRAVAKTSPELAEAQVVWERSMAAAQPEWRAAHPIKADADQGVVLAIEADGAIFAAGRLPEKATYVIEIPASDVPVSGLRIDTMPDDRLPSKGAGRAASGNAVISRVRMGVAGSDLPLAAATADFSQVGFDPAGVLDADPTSGWAFHPDVTTPHFLLVEPAKVIPAGVPLRVTIEFQSANIHHQLGHFRLSTTAGASPASRQQLSAQLTGILAKSPATRTAAESQALAEEFLKTTAHPAVVAAGKARETAEAQRNAFRDALPRVMVMSDAQPRKTHILDRGNYLAPLAEVTPGTPECLPPMAEDEPANRLGLARWLVSPANPLTARVQVNRYWQMFFGRGLVATAENLGVQADVASHPELLDWLAAEFRDTKWDVKHLHRLIVTSATYRQTAKATPQLLEMDPQNRLLARASRYRLTAPVLRDLALSSGGLLDLRVGGKPVYPYQPKGIWDGLAITKERDFTYPQSTGADLHRRSLYTFWRRTVAPGNMFDASSRTICSVKPSLTNTPIHALTTLNDITWVEASRALAATVIGEAGAEDANAQLARAFLRVCSRTPEAKELQILLRSFTKARDEFAADPAAAKAYLSHGEAAHEAPVDPAHFAALAAVCLSILNLDEALTRG